MNNLIDINCEACDYTIYRVDTLNEVDYRIHLCRKCDLDIRQSRYRYELVNHLSKLDK